MQKLVDGIHNFQRTIFPEHQGFFEGLAAGQAPLALFVTCSDSRVNPNLITQTDPGDLFIHRNVGNIIPPYGASQGGEGATIEYAGKCSAFATSSCVATRAAAPWPPWLVPTCVASTPAWPTGCRMPTPRAASSERSTRS